MLLRKLIKLSEFLRDNKSYMIKWKVFNYTFISPSGRLGK